MSEEPDARSMWKWMLGSAFLASMCCLPSVVLVMFGLASVSTAAALSNKLYWGEGGFWWFRPTMLLIAFTFVVINVMLNDPPSFTLEVERESVYVGEYALALDPAITGPGSFSVA